MINPEIILKNDGCTIQEYDLINEIGTHFYHSAVINNQGIAISAGYGSSIHDSRKIAFSEYLERKYIAELKSTSYEKSSWGFDLISTGCGFAFGYEKNKTELRSLSEAVERWVLSNCIDEKYKMEKVNYKNLNLGKITNWYLSQFEKVHFYFKEVLIHHQGSFIKFYALLCVAVSGKGVYQGSSARMHFNEDLFLHAIIESFRHLLIVRNNKVINTFPENRIRFFANNADLALDQINSAYKTEWPLPSLKFQKTQIMNENCFLARTILHGWSCWNTSDLNRFLY